MTHYLPWLIGGLVVGLVIVALLYARFNQVESD
jgi:hypothetical protein